jgi:hypothetical protein
VETAIGVYFVVNLVIVHVGGEPSALKATVAVLLAAVVGLLLQRFVVRPRRGYVEFRLAERLRAGLLTLSLAAWLVVPLIMDVMSAPASHDVFGWAMLYTAQSPAMVGLLMGFLPIALLAICFDLPRLLYLAAAWGLVLSGCAEFARSSFPPPSGPFTDMLFGDTPAFIMPVGMFLITARVALIIGTLAYGAVKLLHLIARVKPQRSHIESNPEHFSGLVK